MDRAGLFFYIMLCVVIVFVLLGLREVCLYNSDTDSEDVKLCTELDGSNTVSYSIDPECRYEIVIEPGSEDLRISVIEVR